MKKIQLTQNKVAIVDDEDYVELNKYNWYTNKSINTCYARRKVKKELNKTTILMHRQIMNPPDNMLIDHINGNGLDNRKENLRICTRSQNNFNIIIPKHNTSGIKGVSFDKSKNKYIANIRVNNTTRHLGAFANKLEAKDAYTKAAKKYHKEFYSDGIRKVNKELQKEINSVELLVKSRSKSGIKGVTWCKKSNNWQARVIINGKREHLGLFNSVVEAKNVINLKNKDINLYG
jgi:hypothetical protein